MYPIQVEIPASVCCSISRNDWPYSNRSFGCVSAHILSSEIILRSLLRLCSYRSILFYSSVHSFSRSCSSISPSLGSKYVLRWLVSCLWTGNFEEGNPRDFFFEDSWIEVNMPKSTWVPSLTFKYLGMFYDTRVASVLAAHHRIIMVLQLVRHRVHVQITTVRDLFPALGVLCSVAVW